MSDLTELVEMRDAAESLRAMADTAQTEYVQELARILSSSKAQDVADALGVTRTGLYQTLRRHERRAWGTVPASPVSSGLTIDDYRAERQRQVDALEAVTGGYAGDVKHHRETGGKMPVTYRQWLKGSRQAVNGR